jgi:hypothetical protein
MSSVAAYPAYPARVEARMDQPLSRWLWLDMGEHEPGGPEPGGA